jgi:heme/copper-type cytochrome/quinol oxidase subunit 1
MELNGVLFTEVKNDTLTKTGGWTVYPPLSGLGETKPSTFKPDKNPGYTSLKIPSNTYWKFIGLVLILILYVTMVYGPIAAFLVELFPTRIRYTSMSLPYHIGNGVFGGLVPFIGLLLTTTYPADPLVGLWYPIGVATLCLVIGTLYLRNKIDENIRD